MFTSRFEIRWPVSVAALRIAFSVAILCGASVLVCSAQAVETSDPTTATATTATPQKISTGKVSQTGSIPLPLVTSYKDVKIGSSADEVRKTLGKAKIDDKDGFYYRFENEFAQIRLDKSGNVRVISVTYSNGNESTPSYAAIFGTDAPAAVIKPDGSIYSLVRYPEAGFWIAYSRTAGNDASVTVTIQKLP